MAGAEPLIEEGSPPLKIEDKMVQIKKIKNSCKKVNKKIYP